MNRILFLTIVFLIGFSNCKPKESTSSETTETVTQSFSEAVEQGQQQEQLVEQQVKTVERADLSFLLKMGGKYPYETELFRNEPMKTRIESIVDGKYQIFLERMEIQTPIEVNGNEVFMEGFMKHSGGEEEAALYVDVSKNLMWVLMFENGKDMSIFKDDRDVRLPLRVIRKVQELSN